jgi:hypothetical protein
MNEPISGFFILKLLVTAAGLIVALAAALVIGNGKSRSFSDRKRDLF